MLGRQPRRRRARWSPTCTADRRRCICIRRLLPHRDHGDDPCEATVQPRRGPSPRWRPPALEGRTWRRPPSRPATRVHVRDRSVAARISPRGLTRTRRLPRIARNVLPDVSAADPAACSSHRKRARRAPRSASSPSAVVACTTDPPRRAQAVHQPRGVLIGQHRGRGRSETAAELTEVLRGLGELRGSGPRRPSTVRRTASTSGATSAYVTRPPG